MVRVVGGADDGLGVLRDLVRFGFVLVLSALRGITHPCPYGIINKDIGSIYSKSNLYLKNQLTYPESSVQ